MWLRAVEVGPEGGGSQMGADPRALPRALSPACPLMAAVPGGSPPRAGHVRSRLPAENFLRDVPNTLLLV